METINYFFLCVIIAFSVSCTTQAKVDNKRPNVLFIAVDDLRLQAGLYGQDQMITPSLDLLGEQGVVFTRAYCSVPVCGASRASLLSGLRPTPERFVNYYARKDKEAPDVASLPMFFKENGYTTLSRGKIYHHANDDTAAWSEKPHMPQAGIGWQAYLTEESEKLINENRTEENPNYVKGPAFEAADVDDNAYPDGMLTDKVLEDLKKFSETGESFFLAVGFWKPHLPFNAPKKYWDLYDEDDIVLADNPNMPEGAPREARHNWSELRNMYTGIPGQGPLSEELARKLVHGYYACVSYTDAQIGMILKEMENLGLDENTIVVLWGDHGWHLGEHGLWCKHCNFDRVLNAPLIIKDAGMNKGVKTDALVEFIDIYPTLCDLTGLEKPSHLDGKSLEEVLENPEKEHKEAVFSRYHDGESVITENFVYTKWVRDGKKVSEMLYDHRNDPKENINVVDQAEYKELVSEMEQLLEEKDST